MKHSIFTTCFFLLFTIHIQAQSEIFSLAEVDNAPIISKCTNSLSSKDCFIEKLNNYIKSNIDIMKLVKRKDLPGKAYVQFEVNATGEIEQVKVRTRNKFLEKEALRLFAQLKIKEPATKNSKKVAIKHTIPITFNLLKFESYEEFGREIKNKN
ncbi:TonB family protein [Salegentibacter sp. Hel_I_6]|uniref:TonB family protein n=1 Tax=Salegentibacter sp. Hel_I_6 TaxID=1250278 RepID=UPI00055E6BD4|nr:TonB family protein [Salegentibacter sp. Hel_I_6]